ncbi:hypothetical protein LR48_Vigan08g106600 [Vigna angularis]|uniref:Uncharacterized protein n=1 Tax=Phaseolus angularis TaxID=3914 RepID=A0A0L9V6C3_PHAAN|nr:uncharacterized protein HKW66_Vig0145800 [Vigna angularis]KOM50239.1 hypothetical protein LR48_Vigan08g106600 [Vigna angularis]
MKKAPYYSGFSSDKWHGDFSKEDEKNFGDDGDDDYNMFEFFSEEFNSSSNIAATENIIFCGKLIPFKDIPPRVDECNNKACRNVQKGIAKHGSKGSKSFSCDYTSTRKVSLVRCTTKYRWFLFMFEMSKLSGTTEMELRDIRNRQSWRGPATMFPIAKDGEEDSKGKMRSCKGMWTILKSISSIVDPSIMAKEVL